MLLVPRDTAPFALAGRIVFVGLHLAVELCGLSKPRTKQIEMRNSRERALRALDELAQIAAVVACRSARIVVVQRREGIERVGNGLMQHWIGIDANVRMPVAQIVEIVVDRLERRHDGDVRARRAWFEKGCEDASAGDMVGLPVNAGQCLRAQRRIGNCRRALSNRGERGG
jgi:hypothetical protein